uniref:Uncharacterized protein n=1 Tax=Oryza punctata TaxID=4537 RepID=A0A0E0M7X8_ORYPU
MLLVQQQQQRGGRKKPNQEGQGAVRFKFPLHCTLPSCLATATLQDWRQIIDLRAARTRMATNPLSCGFLLARPAAAVRHTDQDVEYSN